MILMMRLSLSLPLVIVLMIATAESNAQSALPLLSGFDEQRIAAIFAQPNEVNQGELAKLLYRLDHLDASSLNSLADEPSAVGDVVSFAGSVREVKRMSVPQELVEFLEFDHFTKIAVELENDAQGLVFWLYVQDAPQQLALGDRVSATGVVLQPAAAVQVISIASSSLHWTPANAQGSGPQLLAKLGVDLAAVLKIAERNRQPLQSSDADAFYSMMAAAKAISSVDASTPQRVEPAMLLKQPGDFVGAWIRLEAETVRVTRVVVTDAQRQQQLGSNEYYQIDAIGDLDNVVIELQRTEGEPVRFENRYPVVLVTAQLPDFLQSRMNTPSGEASGVELITVRMEVDGFFFRLWSYESDRMNRDGKGEQIGPLVIASRFRSLQITGTDPIGVSKIGYIAATGVILGVVFVWVWNRHNRHVDAVARSDKNKPQKIDLDL